MTTLQTSINPLQAQIETLVEEAISDSDLFLVDLVVRGRAGSRVVEVYLDRDEGAGLDEIAEASRRLSFLLDTEDPIKGKYNLNVSSPGVDRSLLLQRQYPRHVGKSLRIVHTMEGEEFTSIGTLEAADEQSISLLIPKTEEPLTIPYTSIREARVELPW